MMDTYIYSCLGNLFQQDKNLYTQESAKISCFNWLVPQSHQDNIIISIILAILCSVYLVTVRSTSRVLCQIQQKIKTTKMGIVQESCLELSGTSKTHRSIVNSRTSQRVLLQTLTKMANRFMLIKSIAMAMFLLFQFVRPMILLLSFSYHADLFRLLPSLSKLKLSAANQSQIGKVVDALQLAARRLSF